MIARESKQKLGATALKAALARLAETRYARCSLVIVLIGILLRLVAIAWTTSPQDPMNQLYPGYTDGAEYVDIARSLVVDGVYGYGGRPSAFRPPAYPILIACTWWVFGETLTPVRLLQTGLYVLMTMAYARVVVHRFGRMAGLMTSLVFSAYPLFVFMATEIATECLYMTLAASIFALTFVLLDRSLAPGRRTGAALAAGVCGGLGILTRPNMLFVLVLIIALLVWDSLRRRREPLGWLAPVMTLLAATVLVLTPWLLRNERQFGAAVVSTNLQYNLFRGTFDLIDGIPMGRNIGEVFRAHNVVYEEDIEDDKRTSLPMDEVSNERNAHAAAISIVRADPVGWVWQRFRNAVHLWLNLQWEPSFDWSSLLVIASVSTSLVYYLLLVTALIGSVLLWRSGREAPARKFVVRAWLFALAAMSMVVTFIGKRYRVAMIDPYLALIAGLQVAWWLGGRRFTAAGIPDEAPTA